MWARRQDVALIIFFLDIKNRCSVEGGIVDWMAFKEYIEVPDYLLTKPPNKPNPPPTPSTNILPPLLPSHPLPQIHLQRPPKQLQQHLEADPRNTRVVTAFTQLIADERIYPPTISAKPSIPLTVTSEARTPTLRPGNFIEAKADALLMQRLPDQISARRRDVGVFLAEDLFRIRCLIS